MRVFLGKPHVVVGLGYLVRLRVHQSFVWPKSGVVEADRARKTARLRCGGRVRKIWLSRLEPQAGLGSRGQPCLSKGCLPGCDGLLLGVAWPRGRCGWREDGARVACATAAAAGAATRRDSREDFGPRHAFWTDPVTAWGGLGRGTFDDTMAGRSWHDRRRNRGGKERSRREKVRERERKEKKEKEKRESSRRFSGF